nr:MAG TPA: hypothetical protein [Caudoviricetes sp.]
MCIKNTMAIVHIVAAPYRKQERQKYTKTKISNLST